MLHFIYVGIVKCHGFLRGIGDETSRTVVGAGYYSPVHNPVFHNVTPVKSARSAPEAEESQQADDEHHHTQWYDDSQNHSH